MAAATAGPGTSIGRQIVAAREAAGLRSQQALLEAVTDVRRRRPGRERKTVSPGTIVRAENGGNISTDLLEDIRLALGAIVRVMFQPPSAETSGRTNDLAEPGRVPVSKGGHMLTMDGIPDAELFGRLYGFWWSQASRQHREELLGLCEKYVKGDPSILKIARETREKKESA